MSAHFSLGFWIVHTFIPYICLFAFCFVLFSVVGFYGIVGSLSIGTILSHLPFRHDRVKKYFIEKVSQIKNCVQRLPSQHVRSPLDVRVRRNPAMTSVSFFPILAQNNMVSPAKYSNTALKSYTSQTIPRYPKDQVKVPSFSLILSPPSNRSSDTTNEGIIATITNWIGIKLLAACLSAVEHQVQHPWFRFEVVLWHFFVEECFLHFPNGIFLSSPSWFCN